MEINLEQVDKKLDDIETTIAIFEQKLSSIPPKVFENIPQMETQTQALAPTQNPLSATPSLAAPAGATVVTGTGGPPPPPGAGVPPPPGAPPSGNIPLPPGQDVPSLSP